jgi:hypothetical protein
MIIEIYLDYSRNGVVCFDPERIMLRLLDEFSEASTDWEDHAAAELQSMIAFVQGGRNLVSSEHGKQMVAPIRRRTWQNGPAFLFTLDVESHAKIKGWVRRYRIGFESEAEMAEDLHHRVVRFLEGLGIGAVAFR